MNTNAEICNRFALLAVMIATHVPLPACAQFVPGMVFSASPSDPQCNHPVDYVLGIHPLWAPHWEAGYFDAAVEGCPGLHSVAMSPDGKHLRVAAAHWGVILEFDSGGNWEIVIDGSDGVIPQGYWNSIAYDREGNFYVSGRGNVKVMKFPADGSTPEPLAFYNNDGVILDDSYGLSVGPSGEVYVANHNKLMRIAIDGSVSLFDTYPQFGFIYSVLLDDFGYVHAQLGGLWYRYVSGNAASREVFADCDGVDEDICSSLALTLSTDRKRIYSYHHATSNDYLLSVDPVDGSVEIVMPFVPVSNLTVVPLRGDVDGDGNTDLYDLDWFAACMEGAGIEIPAHCHLADMDADGDGDLFDLRYFMLGHSAYTGNN